VCHIQIDNGAFTDQQPELGNLVALNLDTMQLTFQPWIDGKASLRSTMKLHPMIAAHCQLERLTSFCGGVFI